MKEIFKPLDGCRNQVMNGMASSVHDVQQVQIKEILPCYLFGPCLLVIHTISCIFCDSRRNKRKDN